LKIIFVCFRKNNRILILIKIKNVEIQQMINNFIKALIVFGIFDYFWLGKINNDLYTNTIQNIQGSPILMRVAPAATAYILMALSISLLLKGCNVNENNVMWIGAIVGFIIYGIYNGTNHAILNDWSLKTSLIDTSWGTFLFGITAYIVFNSKKWINF
jgi:uncharacterized membrane protein